MPLNLVHPQLLYMLFLSFYAALTLFYIGLGLVKPSAHAMDNSLRATEIFSS